MQSIECTFLIPFILYPTWTFLPRLRLLARIIPFTALRNFEFFSIRPSAAARSKPESCFCGLGFVGASNLFCGLGGGWSGDRAAWRSSAASAGSGRLWGGDEALCRNEPGWLWGGDPALSRRKDMAARRADGVSTLYTRCRLADCGGCPVALRRQLAAVRCI